MKFFLAVLLVPFAFAQRPAPAKPKLVVAIAVDQFRYDYLVKFRSEYTGGLDQLLRRGAVFSNAYYEHFPTVTAVGHSTFLSGAYPASSGIIANDWWDRELRRSVTSVFDPSVKGLGDEKETASPRRMLVSTVGDELKMVSPKSKVIGVSLKDRSAILPAGHMANGAYWVSKTNGKFVSSTYYFDGVPDWVTKFNDAKAADRYANSVWDLKAYGGLKRTLKTPADVDYYDSIASTPYGNELIEEFCERAIAEEKLGQRGVTDVLAVSFSSNDYVGHDYGPDSPEVRAVSVHTDRLFAKFFASLDRTVGMANVLVVLTADHGVAPMPEVNRERRMPGGRMTAGVIRDTVERALGAKFGIAKYVLSPSDYSLYLDDALIERRGLNMAEVRRVAAEAARKVDHVARVYTRDQLLAGPPASEMVARRVSNGYNEERGADLMIVLEPYFMYVKTGSTHGSPYNYDAHVPVIFLGARIKPGRYWGQVAVNDIAPTLASLLDVDAPSGSAGRVLTEMLQ